MSSRQEGLRVDPEAGLWLVHFSAVECHTGTYLSRRWALIAKVPFTPKGHRVLEDVLTWLTNEHGCIICTAWMSLPYHRKNTSPLTLKSLVHRLTIHGSHAFIFTVCIGNGCNKRGCLISPCICLEYWLCIPPGKYPLCVQCLCSVWVPARSSVCCGSVPNVGSLAAVTVCPEITGLTYTAYPPLSSWLGSNLQRQKPIEALSALDFVFKTEF